jgi:hypothetical protein
MATLRFTSRFNDWTQTGEAEFESARWLDEQIEQVLVFADQAKDGFIEADVVATDGGTGTAGDDKKEVGFLLRCGRSGEGYCAGMGSFNTKFCISRMDQTGWKLLASAGRSSSIEYKRIYKIRVEFTGSQIKLYENGALLLTAVDEAYSSGQFGLRTRKTNATFRQVQLAASRPVCFVVMPFSSELSFVYRTIQDVVKESGFNCIRGDERFTARPVIDEIKEDIARADLVIVDFSGRNPNVYYEAGLADAWKKSWIVIAQSVEDLTFDVKHIRTIIYSDRMGADVRLREELQRAIKETIAFTAPRG